MGFFSRLSTIGNRTLARVIAEHFASEYISVKKEKPEKSNEELIRETLSRMTKWTSAQRLLSSDFLTDKNNLDIEFVIYKYRSRGKSYKQEKVNNSPKQ
jgi:hypothetical protein